jgi:hypothetical protein
VPTVTIWTLVGAGLVIALFAFLILGDGPNG